MELTKLFAVVALFVAGLLVALIATIASRYLVAGNSFTHSSFWTSLGFIGIFAVAASALISIVSV